MKDEGLGVDCVWINMVLLCPPKASHFEECNEEIGVDFNEVKPEKALRICEVEEDAVVVEETTKRRVEA